MAIVCEFVGTFAVLTAVMVLYGVAVAVLAAGVVVFAAGVALELGGP